VPTLRAVLFDVDFTIAKPGPTSGPRATRALGARYGLDLDPSRYEDARLRALDTLERHPELEHDEEVWCCFTERIIRGMGGDSDRAYDCAVEMTRAWEHAHNFDLYDDVLPTLDDLRAPRLKLGLVSNTAPRPAAFVAHHALESTRSASRARTARSKPHESIFRAVLAELEVGARDARWSATTSRTTSRARARSGSDAFLLDRDGRYPDAATRLTDLRELPAALGPSSETELLAPASGVARRARCDAPVTG
jgi:FMN phosphatase YigB (HAD superfamily)